MKTEAMTFMHRLYPDQHELRKNYKYTSKTVSEASGTAFDIRRNDDTELSDEAVPSRTLPPTGTPSRSCTTFSSEKPLLIVRYSTSRKPYRDL